MKRGARAAARAAFFLALCLNIFWPSAGRAKTTTIDDSGTQSLEPTVLMRWKSFAPARSGGDNLMTGTTTLRLRLNLMPWFRRVGRIYLVLPAQPPGPVRAQWTTQGRLLPGQVVSGNRTLVYAGPISARVLEDVLVLQFSVDARLLPRAVPVSFHFDMDEE